MSYRIRPLEELQSSGVLWKMNRSAFHPLGYAVALCLDEDGKVVGWQLQGNGSEVWGFDDETDDSGFARFSQTLGEIN